MGITYRAGYIGETVLTGIEHAHLSDDQIMTEALREGRRQLGKGETLEADEITIGDWTDLDDLAPARKIHRDGVCSRCTCEGVHVDTTTGEIVQGGRVIATYTGASPLMAGEYHGCSALLCDDCAEADEAEVEARR